MTPGYIFFKLFAFSIRRGTVVPRFICYCWNDKAFLDSGPRQVLIGNLLWVGWVRNAANKSVFAVTNRDRLLFSSQPLFPNRTNR